MLRVDVVEGLEDFALLRENWENVYAADPEAQFFLSWTWLSQWLDHYPEDWFILAARPARKDADYVAFFPLRSLLKSQKRTGFYNEIAMAGRGMSDYSGLIADPASVGAAIEAFAAHLRKSPWASLNMQCVRMSQQRMDLLLHHFPKGKFAIHHRNDINPRDNIDNLVCPAISLPETFDAYLATLGSNTRQKIRRFLRKVENSDDLSIVVATDDTIDNDLRQVLRLWAIKWHERKGDRIKSLIRSNYKLLYRAFNDGVLFMPILKRGDEPLAALCTFIDPIKRAMLFYITGRDEQFRGPPPVGVVLHAYSIRWAIEHGFRTYDFLRGNEEYKYMFGVEETTLHHVIVSTRSGVNIGNKLDRRSTPRVLKRAAILHKAGRLPAASLGYQQILDTNPRSPGALYGLGQLLAQTGDHAAAAKHFRTLSELDPDNDKVWLRLGRSLEAQKLYPAAADAYRRAAHCNPASRVAHVKLAAVLRHLGNATEAQAAATTAAALAPPDLKKALESRGVPPFRRKDGRPKPEVPSTALASFLASQPPRT